MGLCCSKENKDNVLLIPQNAPLKPSTSTANYFRIYSKVGKNTFILEHEDFPFLLHGERVEKCTPELPFWLSGVLTPFPFLKNVYWAWPLEAAKGWMIVSDLVESISAEESQEIEMTSITATVEEKTQKPSRQLRLNSSALLLQLAEALNHLHSSALIHGNVCPSSLTYHTLTASLKLSGLNYLQRVIEGQLCRKTVGDDEAFRKPGCELNGYFEEVDWYSFGLLLKWLNESRLNCLADDLLLEKLGTGPAVYSSQIKPRLK